MNKTKAGAVTVFATAIVMALAGCDSKAPGGDIVAKPQATAKTDPLPAPKQEPPPAPKTDIDRSKVPAELQTDAYRYYGLSNPKPLDMELNLKKDNTVLTGATSARMTQVDKSGASFAVETTGSLHETIGDGVVSLKPDGVYEVSSEKEKIDHPMLALPTGVEKGKTWSIDSKVEANARTEREQMTFKSQGIQSLTIGKTTYQALYVVGKGKLTGDARGPITMRQWFVKDIGMVKMEMVQTEKGKPPVTSTMIWKPTDSKAKS